MSLDPHYVDMVYKSYWKYIKEHAGMHVIKDMSPEESISATFNFNIPYIGKLYVPSDKIEKYHRQLNYYRNVRNQENKACRLSGVSD